jgi:murein DD-endopeptidase MepM/ murein hydrolase activator NlpD
VTGDVTNPTPARFTGLALSLAAALAVTMAGAHARALQPAPAAAAPALQVSHEARAIAPGEAVLLTIRAPVELAEVHGTAFGAKFIGYAGAAPNTWRALIGIDLETKPGRAVITIEAATAGGSALRSRYPLTVAPRAFPTRRLTVAPGFVTPPASELARIQRERAVLQRVFSAISPRPLWGSGFARPTGGDVISRFGVRSVFNGQQRAPHRGVDIRGALGTPVSAPAGGVVVLADDLYFSGKTVVLDHGLGVFSLLCHLSRLDVREGAGVERGEAIGAIGATGRVTGPHLHWTIRVGPAGVDPLSVLAVVGMSR